MSKNDTDYDLNERQDTRLMMATQFASAMMSSIGSESEYQRLKALAIAQGCGQVSAWITKEAYKQAESILSHDKALRLREIKRLKDDQ